MLDRLLWLIALLTVVAGMVWLVKRAGSTVSPSRSTAHNLLYFWGPHCAACASVKRTLAELTNDNPSVRLQSINAIENPDEAQRWRVMTIPTVILLDKSAQIVYHAAGNIPVSQLREAVAQHAPPDSPPRVIT